MPFASDYDSGYLQVNSESIVVTIDNPIFYPDWVQEYRDDLLIVRVSSVQASFDWEVRIYGEAEDYIGSFTGHSDNGMIDFAWNVRDPRGVRRSDNIFYSTTTITPTGAGAAAATAATTQQNPLLIKVVDNYPDEGMWVVARSEYMPSTAINYEFYLGAVNGFAQLGETAGGVLPGEPYHGFGEALFLGRTEAGVQSGALARALTNRNVRNFYFDGHGTPDSFGHGWDANGNQRDFPASTIAQLLGNATISTNVTRYRWVFIDSCKSAVGNAWPRAFGLGTRQNVPLQDYTSRPGAFCGFIDEVYAWNPETGGEIDLRSINFRLEFLVWWWVQERGLRDAFDEAQFRSGFRDAPLLRIYGYWGLHWNEYNTKGEWPPP